VVICLTGLCGARRLGAGIELRLSLPAAHPVGSIDEFIRPHAEASIDKVFAVLLQDDNIVLLTQITYDLLNSSSGCDFGRRRVMPRLAASGNFAGRPDTDALNLLVETGRIPLRYRRFSCPRRAGLAFGLVVRQTAIAALLDSIALSSEARFEPDRRSAAHLLWEQPLSAPALPSRPCP